MKKEIQLKNNNKHDLKLPRFNLKIKTGTIEKIMVNDEEIEMIKNTPFLEIVKNKKVEVIK